MDSDIDFARFETIFASGEPADEAACLLDEGVEPHVVIAYLRAAAELNDSGGASNGHDPDLVTAYREHAAMCRQAADELAGESPLQADLFGGARR